MKKLNIWIYIDFAFSILFTLLCFTTHADISLVALPLSLVFTACLAFVVREFFQKDNIKLLNTIRRFYQYQPFVYLTAFVFQRAGSTATPYALDLISVILWVIITASSIFILYYLSDKRVFTLKKEWEKIHKNTPVVKYTGLKWLGFEALEWIDALVQAIYTIILLNIFLFQLYEIPSESMVPEFLIKDRVAVFKTFSGPKFPLSNVGLPYLRKYKRGDIVVLRNPHYKNDRQSEVKTFVSSFVYMATLTLVKMNKDDNGEIKADPLVKRLVGLPGEQLMLMDGSLYARTKESASFTKISDDEKWAAWDLNNLPAKTKAKVEWIPLTSDEVQNTLDVEQMRREMNLESAKIECRSLAKEFSRYTRGRNTSDDEVDKMFTAEQLFEYNLFNNNSDITIKLMTVDGGNQWFTKFMTEWTNDVSLTGTEQDGVLTGDSLVGGDLYSDSNFRLNIMTKIVFGKLLIRNAELLSNNISTNDWKSDATRTAILHDAQNLNAYILRLDQRNMPIFPANDENGNAQYIPANCYFMMGDNRYNSLDMRHSYESSYVPLTSYDPISITYYSDMSPQFVNRSMVLGKASYRFWPLSRIGIPGSSIRK